MRPVQPVGDWLLLAHEAKCRSPRTTHAPRSEARRRVPHPTAHGAVGRWTQLVLDLDVAEGAAIQGRRSPLLAVREKGHGNGSAFAHAHACRAGRDPVHYWGKAGDAVQWFPREHPRAHESLASS